MATTVDHDTMVRLLREEFSAVEALCAGFDADRWEAPTCLPGWSVRDNVSHMVGTESMLAGVDPPAADVAHLDHMKNPIATANEVWVESMRRLPGSEVLARFAEITARRLEALEAMSQDEFDAPSWTPAGPDETYGRFMRIRHYDCFLHEHDIRAAVGAPDREDVAHIRSSLDEVATGLGYIVGRRAALAAGSRVEIRLTGVGATVYRVAVAGRAAVVDELDGAPTVGLTMPVMLFLRLTGGRQDAAPELGRSIACSGDDAAATQLATNLAFTI